MKIYSTSIIASVMAISACTSNQDNATTQEAQNITTESGLMVEIIQQGTGEKPQTGDIVKVHYTGTLKATGEKFDSSVDRGEPIEFPLGIGRVIPGWEEGIAMLNKGTKARLIIPAALGYGEHKTGPIPPNSDLVFEVELVDFKPGPKPITHDPFDISGIAPTKTASGLELYITEKGSGTKVEAGKMVTVHYYGYLHEGGQKFDNSYERGEPIQVPVGMGQVIPGWDEGLALLNVGDKATLIIPHTLAYGDEGFPGVIPPRATLVFDIEVLDVQ